MAIKWYEENGRKKVLISANVRSKINPTIRRQPKKRFDVLDDSMTEQKAEREYKKLWREAQRQVFEAEQIGVTWDKLLDLYEVHAKKLVDLNEWSQRQPCLQDSMSSLRRFSECWMGQAADEISSAEITKLLHSLKAQGYADATRVRFLGDLRKVFDFGILENFLKNTNRNPTIGISIKSRRRKRDEVLFSDEIIKLLVYSKVYEQKWYFIWSFAVYTGMRNGELYALKWSDIDLNEDNPLIRVSRSYSKRTREYKCTKTGETREIPICEPLLKVLYELKQWHSHESVRIEAKTSEFVLPRPGLWQNGSQAQVLRKFCKEIGIRPICFHSLRACFATELLKRGVPVTKVMAIGGWSELKTMKHYIRLSGIDVKGATDPLDFSSPEMQIYPDRTLMKAVGETFAIPEDGKSNVFPLASRQIPRL